MISARWGEHIPAGTTGGVGTLAQAQSHACATAMRLPVTVVLELDFWNGLILRD